jgi:hypothetical protein
MNKTKTICESVSVCNSNATLFRTNYYNHILVFIRSFILVFIRSFILVFIRSFILVFIRSFILVFHCGYKGIYKQTMFTLKGRKINIGFKDQWFWIVMFTSLHHLSRTLLYLELQNHKLLISYLTWIEYIERK